MRASIIAFSLVIAGCGGGGTGGGGSSTSGDLSASTSGDLSAPPDLATGPDLASTPDLRTAPDLASGGAMCGGPADCGGNPCCVKIQNQMFGGTMCTNSMSACPADILGKGQTRLCTSDADCTAGDPNSKEPTCCTGKMGNQMAKVCADKFLASVSGGALTCP